MDESVQLTHSRGGTPAAHRDSQVPLGWTKHLLSDVGHIVTGRTPPGTAEIYFGGEVRFLTPTDMDGRRICDVTSRTLSPLGQEKLKRVLIRSGVAVSCIGWQMGKAILVDRPTITNQQINTVIPHEVVSAEFLYYMLSSRRAEIFALGAGGSRTPILNKSDFGKLQVELPNVNEQEQIVSTLRALDQRIELLRAENETLEAMARAIFKSWFVDFDPVRAKAEGREPEGMDATTAALFPSEFQGSGLGPIPHGWAIDSILKVASLLSGGTPKTNRDDYWDGAIKWASAKDASQCPSTFLLETERKITALGLAESSTKLIPARCTVVVARGATTGRMVIFGEEMAMNQTCYALSSKTNTPFALYGLFRNIVSRLVHGAHGSVFETITTATFEKTQVLIPPAELLMTYETLLEPLYSKMLANTAQQSTLIGLRDTLLPRLISGKLRVPEAESMLTEVI